MYSFNTIALLSGRMGLHQLGNAFSCHRWDTSRRFPFWAKDIGAEADPVGEEDFFKGPGGISIIG